jgi:hypothetical protein
MPLQTITSRLRSLSKRMLARIFMTGGSRLVSLGVAMAFLTFIMDFGLKLPVGVRAVLLVGCLGVLGVIAWRHFVRPLTLKPSIDELALMVEESDPALNDQLISAIQLERDLREGNAVESPELIAIHVEETARKLRNYRFSRAVSFRDCLKPVTMGACAAVIFFSATVLFPLHAELWFKRQILLGRVSWPRETTLVINIPDIQRFNPEYVYDDSGVLERAILRVPERTPLQVRVSADGVLPDEVDLVTAPLEDPDLAQPIAMGLPMGKEYFQHIFPPLTRSLLFHAEGGDDTDEMPLYELRVAKAPRVTRFWADYEYPEYTGLARQTLSDANISAPEGTRIIMHFEVNMPLSEFTLLFESGEAHQIEADTDGTLSRSCLVEANDFYTYRLKGENDVVGAEPPRYVITAEVDQAPRISVSIPETAEMSLTPSAIIPMLGSVTDDYGVAAVGFRWGTDPRTLDSGSRNFTPEQTGDSLGQRRVRFFEAVSLADLQIKQQDAEGQETGDAPRSPKEGDRLHLGFLAVDTRKTVSKPEPHRVFGDFDHHILVLSAQDLERELTQRQVQIKGWVGRISDLVSARTIDIHGLIDLAKNSSDAPDPQEVRTRFLRIEQELRRITGDLVNTQRVFRRVYAAYLWNRLEPENSLTEKLVAGFSNLYAKEMGLDAGTIEQKVIEEVRPLLDESSTMGVLSLILDLFRKVAHERSPTVEKLVTRAGMVTGSGEQVELLESALNEQRLLEQDLLLLADRLQAWEDFLGVLQGFQDALDMQEGIRKNIEKLTKKK